MVSSRKRKRMKKKGEETSGSKKIYSGVNTAVKRPSFGHVARLFSDANISRDLHSFHHFCSTDTFHAQFSKVRVTQII